MKNILIYGLQRSGTNFLETLLKSNYHLHVLNYNKNRAHPLQKHFRLYDNKLAIPEAQYSNDLYFNSFKEYEDSLELNKEVDLYLVISKDPYSWYLSYTKWAKRCNWPDVDYHYLEEYQQFYSKWLQFSKENDRIVLLNYRNLILDTEIALKKLEDKYQFKLKATRRIMGRKIKFHKVSQSSSFHNDKLNFYKEKAYLSENNTELISDVKKYISPELMSNLGYELPEELRV